jgi:hypothetical protein
MLVWTMQQVQFPVSIVADVSMIAAAWRNAHAGRIFFQFLHSTVQMFSVDTKNLKHDASSTCVPICASTCTKYVFYHLL